MNDPNRLCQTQTTHTRNLSAKVNFFSELSCSQSLFSYDLFSSNSRIQDCSAATENILLAAHGLGLGAVWTGLYPGEDRVKAMSELLKLPDTIIPLCAIIIGYPAESPQPKDKWLPENVSYNEYQH
ncbi:MAG: nitroreductase family protein [Bacteroidaceae bacterium]|nr:nitroreductase family protein [Bacteroidaceae bacterium]